MSTANPPWDSTGDFKIREGGGMTASGNFDPTGPSLESEVNVDAVALTPFQPIVDAVANIVLHSGTFSSSGKLTYGQTSAGGDLAYAGGVNLAQLRITEPGSKDTLLGWKALSTEQLKLTLQPNRLDIRELKLLQPVAQLIIHEDGSVNLANVIKDRGGAAIPVGGGAAKDAKNGSFPVSVKKVRVDKGSLDFADLTLTPQFGTKIEALSGGDRRDVILTECSRPGRTRRQGRSVWPSQNQRGDQYVRSGGFHGHHHGL